MLFTKLFSGFSILILGWFQMGTFSKTDYQSTSRIEKKSINNIQDNGKEIYTDYCIQCHGANGKGDGKNFPPLDGSDWLKKKRTQSIHAVKFGQSGEIIVNKIKFNNMMPAMGLSNEEVAAVMNYIMNSWSNKQGKKVTVKEVAGLK